MTAPDEKATAPSVADIADDGVPCVARETIDLAKRSRSVPGDDTAGRSVPSRGRRLRLHAAASFLFGLTIVYIVYRRGFDFEWSELWAHAASANAGLLLLAFVVFYCSFPVRALRWRMLLENVGYRRAAGVPSTAGLIRIMYLAWFANCITIARLGDAYRAYLLRKVAGVSFAVTLGTILAERLLDLISLAAMLGATMLIAFGATLPPDVAGAFAVGLILSTIGVCGVLAMRHLRGAVERMVPARLRGYYERLEHGTAGSFKHVLRLAAYSAAGWTLEGATLYLTAAAVGAPVPVAAALAVALVASLLTAVPLTPSGLGFTEAGTVLLLTWLGLDTDVASTVALLFRAINYWSIVALGSVLYILTRYATLLHRQPAANHCCFQRTCRPRDASFGPRKEP